MKIRELRILVVDEDLRRLESTLQMLENEGFQYYGTTSRQEALDFAKEEPVNMFILNLDSSGEGCDFLQELRTARPDMKILVTTDYLKASLCSAVRLSGASSILQRPYSAQMLRDSVRIIAAE